MTLPIHAVLPDLLDTLRCTWALRPQGIEWPRHDDGRPSLVMDRALVLVQDPVATLAWTERNLPC